MGSNRPMTRLSLPRSAQKYGMVLRSDVVPEKHLLDAGFFFGFASGQP